MKKIKNIIILAFELIWSYVMAYCSTMINAQMNDVIFDMCNGRYVIGIFSMTLNPFLFTLIGIQAMHLLRAENIWEYAVPVVCALHLVLMPLIWTPIVPNALTTLKIMHTQNSGFISMFLLNNFILIWLSFSTLRKTKKIEESLKELS